VLSSESEFLKSILNAMPSPVLVVEEDVRIVDFNSAAARLLGSHPEMMLRTRAGEALHCLHAKDDPKGCGHGPTCKACILRDSVNNSLSGKHIVRRNAKVNIEVIEGKPVQLHFLVTAAPFEYETCTLALLVLEDITELIALRGLLPICAHCKKIRNDENYWVTVEHFFSAHLDVDFSHGLCPDCVKHLYPNYSPGKDSSSSA